MYINTHIYIYRERAYRVCDARAPRSRFRRVGLST